MNIESYTTPDDAIAAASKLDAQGEWAAAIDLYNQAAQRWPEYAEYTQGCIDSVSEKQSLQDGSCSVRAHGQLDRGTFYCCGGCCLVVILMVAAMFVSTLWAIWEPVWRAERIHQAIKPGMSFEEVESLLTGRYFCFYEAKMDGEWVYVPRSKFTDFVDTASTDDAPALRLSLTLLNITPSRVSFSVELDRAGEVVNATEPYGWD